MIGVTRRELFVDLEYSCKFCGDTGKIQFFRNDWNDFDEVECQNCYLK